MEIRRATGRAGLLDDEQVLGVVEYIYGLHFELSCLLAEMVRYGASLRANLYARLIILTVYEATKEMKGLLAGDFRDRITRVTRGPEIGEALKAIHSSAVKLFDRCNAKFGAVRHGAAAHRPVDPETRIKLVQQADIEKVAKLTIEMQKVISQLTRQFNSYGADLMERLVSARAWIRQ